jgi:hypothetical protein
MASSRDCVLPAGAGKRVVHGMAGERIWKAVPDAEFAEATETVLDGLTKVPALGVMATRNAIRGSWLHGLDVHSISSVTISAASA